MPTYARQPLWAALSTVRAREDGKMASYGFLVTSLERVGGEGTKGTGCYSVSAFGPLAKFCAPTKQLSGSWIESLGFSNSKD